MSEEARHSSESDSLSLVLRRHALNASMFFSGTMCGSAEYENETAYGYLHLLRSGVLTIEGEAPEPLVIDRPSLVLWTRPGTHRMAADLESGADLVCARLAFTGEDANPLLLGFPDQLVIALEDLEGLAPVLERLFDEAFSENYGHRAAIDLLLQLLLVMLLRHCVEEGSLESGLLSGLSDDRLSRALHAIHGGPDRDWNVERLADEAGMSRASFAATFKDRIGVSPGDYLTVVRLAIAKSELEAGRPLKAIARDVGYKSTTALSRAFHRRFGCSPRDWAEGQM